MSNDNIKLCHYVHASRDELWGMNEALKDEVLCSKVVVSGLCVYRFHFLGDKCLCFESGNHRHFYKRVFNKWYSSGCLAFKDLEEGISYEKHN